MPVRKPRRRHQCVCQHGHVLANHFGDRIADRYDASTADRFAPEVLSPTVDFLAELAGDGAAIEFGIGTGRVALPLSERGVSVSGIDLSPQMVDKMKAKPGADRIDVEVGDFTNTRLPGEFRLAYLVFNTVTNLTSQDEQVACFRNVAAHLEPGGCFVIEVFVPGLRRLPPGQTAQPFLVSDDGLGFDEYDVANQGLVSHHYWTEEGQVQHSFAPFRYVWPSELDLMARLAGMRLRERWADWQRSPFTSESTAHVSVWERTAAEAADH